MAEESVAICTWMSLEVQRVIGRRLHLLVGNRLLYRLHKQGVCMADLATATFNSLLLFLVAH